MLEYYDVPEALQQSLGVSVDAFDVFVPSQKLAFEYQGTQHSIQAKLTLYQDHNIIS